MGKFNKTGKREMPALNTSSLPDLISLHVPAVKVCLRWIICGTDWER